MSPVHAFLEPLNPAGTPGEAPAIDPVEKQRKAAYDEGYEHGLVEGARRRSTEIGDTLAQLQSDIDRLALDMEAAESRVAAAALELTRDILEKTLPTLCRRGFTAEALPLIQGVLAALPSFDLTIAVPEDLVDAVRGGLSIDGKAGKLTVTQSDEGADAARAELVWPNGTAQVDLDRVAREMLDMLDSHIAGIQVPTKRSDDDGK